MRLVPPGSFIELSQPDLERVAMAEHARWHRRRLAAGWTTGASWLAVPWAELPDGERAQRVADTRQQLAQLEDVGFLPVVPAGGPPAAASFERVGAVSAERLTAPLRWTLPSGEQCSGRPATGGSSTPPATCGRSPTPSSGQATPRSTTGGGGASAPSGPGRSGRPW